MNHPQRPPAPAAPSATATSPPRLHPRSWPAPARSLRSPNRPSASATRDAHGSSAWCRAISRSGGPCRAWTPMPSMTRSAPRPCSAPAADMRRVAAVDGKTLRGSGTAWPATRWPRLTAPPAWSWGRSMCRADSGSSPCASHRHHDGPGALTPAAEMRGNGSQNAVEYQPDVVNPAAG